MTKSSRNVLVWLAFCFYIVLFSHGFLWICEVNFLCLVLQTISIYINDIVCKLPPNIKISKKSWLCQRQTRQSSLRTGVSAIKMPEMWGATPDQHHDEHFSLWMTVFQILSPPFFPSTSLHSDRNSTGQWCSRHNRKWRYHVSSPLCLSSHSSTFLLPQSCHCSIYS